ncbi:MAG: 2-oxoacid:acceptor oxidoreductase family protein [Planctomycetota bacterium]|nr:2-oxoacid:acceptor oxidoreductase family protein [Planctomycetota bacterium]MDI6788091.1 2-oxoacid:acceptor oxidoreductase family protein [Planctomycetota bacterium]
MLEIRLHGRGGQGGVVALEILANAYFKQNQFVQVFPEFGAERRGAPVASFMRVDTHPVKLRCKIYNPDCIIVLDPVLLNAVDVTVGLKADGWILINTDKSAADLKLPDKFNIATINATPIALQHRLGSRTSPIINTTMLGAFCRLPYNLDISNLKKAIKGKISIKTNDNILSAEEAYRDVKLHMPQ